MDVMHYPKRHFKSLKNKPRSGLLNDDRRSISRNSSISFPHPSLAQQNMKDDTDINVIVRRFGLTGQLPVALRAPTYGDFSQIVDFQGAQNAIICAKDAFMQMPAGIRKRFGNDPHEFVIFCSDEKNVDEMRKMGLVPPVVVPEPEKVMKVEVVPASTPSTA